MSQLSLPGVAADTSTEWVWMEDDSVSDGDDFHHVTVMRDEVVRALAPASGLTYVDATLGGGGHTEAILEANSGAEVIAFDRDPSAIAAARMRLSRFGDRVRIIRANFSRLEEELAALGIVRVNGVCADLGVSSPQIDDPERGMSFRHDGPLDMRMDPDGEETARDLIASSSEEELANILFRYGDERRSRRIARSLHRALEQGALNSTLELRKAVIRAVGPVRVGGIDPATRTFQALRIAVNRELEELEALVASLPTVLATGGTAAIISFHSLEDRIVKHAFQDRAAWAPHFKKPQVATDEECSRNPRARSAKLRAAERVRESEG